MKLRPCIDIHDGSVKQIVGASLEKASGVRENFVSSRDALYYAQLYDRYSLEGGHIIILNKRGTPEYEASVRTALPVLKECPGRWQIGGGITADNASFFLEQGADKVIVTSFVFHDGILDRERLSDLVRIAGREHLVLDLSCRRADGRYLISTDRWTKITETEVNHATLDDLMESCSEFLIHAVDVEGSLSGIDRKLAEILGSWGKIPVTYAGGVRDTDDLRVLRECGNGNLDVTIGSALDIFGGHLSLEEIVNVIKEAG